MKQSIEMMKNSIWRVLQDDLRAIYLYGSAVMDDFKLGWSDIDILCLTNAMPTDAQAGTS